MHKQIIHTAQTSTSWDVPYTFSGKEKDAEIKSLGSDSLNTIENK